MDQVTVEQLRNLDKRNQYRFEHVLDTLNAIGYFLAKASGEEPVSHKSHESFKKDIQASLEYKFPI